MDYSQYPRRYPDDFTDIKGAIEKFILPGFLPDTKLISKETIIRTQGSCFAENLFKAIKARKFKVKHFDFPEAVNSPIANRIFFDRLAGTPNFGHNPVHDRLFPADLIEAVKSTLPEEKLFIFTIGVAGCWYDRQANSPVIDINPKELEGFEFRWQSVKENVLHLASIIKTLKHLSPDIHIVLTLSPVPLNRAFGQNSAVTADCVSKSILRVAIQDVMSTVPENISYWPSFEIVRWLGGHLPPVFGVDDGFARHVSKDMVNIVVDLFIKHYAEGR